MKKIELDEVIKTSPIIIHQGRFAYLKVKKDKNSNQFELKNHFLVSQDQDEITIITKEINLDRTDYEASTKWFNLYEIKVSMPFEVPGFLAKISSEIADQGMNILIVSTYSKDYVLIKYEDKKKAVNVLKNIGFKITDDNKRKDFVKMLKDIFKNPKVNKNQK